jgi:hypothetical protein
MPPGGEAKAAGGLTGVAQANCSCETTAFGMACPTFDGGSTLDGCAIEPVTSADGCSRAACSGAEWDVHPDKTRQAETIADKANERMRTRTQDNLR